MKIAASVLLMFMLQACTNNVQPVIYGPGEMYTNWANKRIKDCRMEAAIVTIGKFEVNPEMNGYELRELNKYLEAKCFYFYGLAI